MFHFPGVVCFENCNSGLRGAENTCLWSDVVTNRRTVTCDQKCLRWRIWEFFYTSLLQARWLGLLIAAGGFCSICWDHFCKKKKKKKKEKVRSKKLDRACWSKNLMTNMFVKENNLPTDAKRSAIRKTDLPGVKIQMIKEASVQTNGSEKNYEWSCFKLVGHDRKPRDSI